MNKRLSEIYNNFDIEIQTKSQLRCEALLAKKYDIEQIINCYENVHINEKNIEQKLNKTNLNSFYENGGIFHKLSEEEVNSIIDSDDEIIIVSKLVGSDDVNSLLWLSTRVGRYSELKYDENVDKHKIETIKSYIANNQIMYPMDFIALPNKANRGVAYPLLCNSYNQLYNMGYKYAFIEIYTILGYYDENDKYQELYMENNRSVMLNKVIGAEKLGTTGEITYKIKNYRVRILSNIYGLNLETGISKMQAKIESKQSVHINNTDNLINY